MKRSDTTARFDKRPSGLLDVGIPMKSAIAVVVFVVSTAATAGLAIAQHALWERCQVLSVQRVGTFVGNGVSFKARQADVSCCVKNGGRLCADTLSWRRRKKI
jgi:hypothetical protein